jgi:hypothetical protein
MRVHRRRINIINAQAMNVYIYIYIYIYIAHDFTLEYKCDRLIILLVESSN